MAANYKSGFIENAGARLYYERRGAGTPLLMIHGLVCDSGFFAAAADCLANHFSVITYDRRGYSRSGASATGVYTVSEQAEDAAAIIRQLALSPAYIIAHSAGCQIAWELCMNHPKMVSQIIFFEPLFVEECPPNDPFVEKIRQYLSAGKKELAYATLMVSMKIRDTAAVGRTAEEALREQRNQQHMVTHELESFFHYEPRTSPPIEIPCKICVGEVSRQERSLLYQTAQQMSYQYQIPLLVVPGDHNAPKCRPKEFARAVEWE